MDPVTIIRRYYSPDSDIYDILVTHGQKVSEKCLELAREVSHLEPDQEFIKEAAMLHDIGIFLTHAPEIGCFGKAPYVCHGFLGRTLLDQLNLPRHGLVCERHTGAGISYKNILDQKLPLPHRDMIPISIEEIIICFADKFFSKHPQKQGILKTPATIIQELKTIDPDHAKRFETWRRLFRV